MAPEDSDANLESPGRRAWIALAVLLVAQAMANMDSSIVNVASKTIRSELHASGPLLQLILTGYTLAYGVLVVTGARLGDDGGYRRVFMFGLVGFVAASLLAGLSPNAWTLVACRAVQGLFGAMMVPQILSTIQTMFRGAALQRAVSYYSMILALGVAAGQIFGGAIVQANLFGTGWRVAFLVNVPVGLIVFLVARAVLPRVAAQARKPLDLWGVAILAVSMVALVVPLMFGRDEGWPRWVWISLAVGVIGMTIFIRYERRLVMADRWPLLDLRVLRPAGVKPGLLAICLLNFGFGGTLFPLTLHLQDALHYTPLQAGLMFVPFPIGFATISLLWTRFPRHVQALLPTAGLIGFALSSIGLIVIVRDGWSVAIAALVLLIGGAAMASGMSPLISQVASAVERQHASALSALMATGTLLFAVLAVTSAGGIYLSFAKHGSHGSVTGISFALGLITFLLLMAAAGAIRIRYITGRMASAAVDVDVDRAEVPPAVAPTTVGNAPGAAGE